jgi:hypothetical protein
VDRFEERLAKVSPLRFVASQIVPLGLGGFFFVANMVANRTVWAVVFGCLLLLDGLIVLWWIRARLAR